MQYGAYCLKGDEMNRIRKWSINAISLLPFFIIIPIAAEETIIRDYALPSHGAIYLKVPKQWKDEVKQPPNDLPPTIVFRPPLGDSFQVLITPIWPYKDRPTLSLEKIEQLVRQNAEKTEPQAIERNIEVKKLKGASGQGYYFSATDRAPAPGEYKYMTQGMFRIDDLAITFTILTQDKQDTTLTRTFDMISKAKRSK